MTLLSSNWEDLWTSPPCGRTQGLWSLRAPGVPGPREPLHLPSCRVKNLFRTATETTQALCVCFYTPTHMCSYIHSCFTHAGMSTWVPHGQAHYTHTQPDVHIHTENNPEIDLSSAFTHTHTPRVTTIPLRCDWPGSHMHMRARQKDRRCMAPP